MAGLNGAAGSADKERSAESNRLGLFGRGEEFFEQGGPFVAEGTLRGGATDAVIPVGGVSGVALFAMEVRVDHHAGTGFQFIDFGVGALPIAVCVPPEGAQRGFKRCRRLVPGEGRVEIGGVHGGSLVQIEV